MSRNDFENSRILKSIADALGTEPAAFYIDEGLPSKALEIRELLESFDRIKDSSDRRICLDFINSVVARQGAVPDGS
ncbi:hypothetical protein FV242_16235 [Methylobacterium sp. WL64]|uniref:hypothetical protein n=1 Tax=Methylobacterium sp. WL64 TaxID=2603894 RepID=UPI0011CBBB90|nr:hypothetical protein [Methylobacterium sp. WL64]TXN02032.1 hypothetical protein FV242_16235 [Methylobacterium sp. WL64]